jgi:type II secretory pathway predicted ATPase ExeA
LPAERSAATGVPQPLRSPRIPFGITPDTSFIYSADAHQEALNTLLIGLDTGEGFIKITGEVGTGKTCCAAAFWRRWARDQVVAYLPNPMLEPRIMLIAIAEELGLKLQGMDISSTCSRNSTSICWTWRPRGKLW